MPRSATTTLSLLVLLGCVPSAWACGALEDQASATAPHLAGAPRTEAAGALDEGAAAGVDDEPAGSELLWEPRETDPAVAAHPIEDPNGHALDAFYAALSRTDDGEEGALTRVSHMGDSSIGMDQLPHYLRTRFQDRFGDGGTGFVLLQPHGTNYRNNTVHLSTPAPWDFCFVIFRCQSDGHYGLGGVSADSRGGATTLFHTRRRGDYGRSASRLDLFYAAQPRGGLLELRIDDDTPVRIDTAAEQLVDRYHELSVPPGPHRVRVRAAGRGAVRAYGLVLETEGPGVVWDTLSMIGAFTVRLLSQDPEHFRDQLAHRQSDLVVLGYGGNDLRRHVGGGAGIEQLTEETTELLRRVKAARPEISCLLTGVVEHERSGQTRIRPEHVQAVVDAQRAAAREAGCAFFDVYGAMGGAGSFRRWQRQGLAAADLKHLSPRGRQRLASWMYDALVSGYVTWRRAGGG